MIQARPITTNMIVITTGQCASIATCCDRRHRDFAIGPARAPAVQYGMCAMPSAYTLLTVLGWKGFYLSCHPEGRVAQELMGALSSGSEPPIASVPQNVGATEKCRPPRPNPVPSRCQTLMPADPDACHADPAATPRRRTPPSDPAIGSRSRTLLSVIRSGYIYEICVCIECVTLHVVHAYPAYRGMCVLRWK